MDALQPGDPGSVGGYRLVGRLGAGGMGQVFLGVSPGGRRVAVKLIHPAHAGTAQFRERFAREIEAARRVGGFHTAPVVDADPGADPPWMVTAFIEGPSLQDDVDRRGPLPADGVRALGAGLAEGLAAIHACGLVHRDLKPANVILAPDGPRIIDFGIARAIGATTGLTSTGVVVGTLTYMSPEQIRGDPVGPASDVFALGSVLAFAATGRAPFGDDSAATVMFRIFTEPPDLAGVADERLRQVIGGCQAKAPQDRPAVPALLSALGGPAPTGSPPSGVRPTGTVPAGDWATSPPPSAARPTGAPSAGAWATSPPAVEARPTGRPAMRDRRSRRKPAVIAAAATVVAAAIAVILAISLSTGGTPPASAGSHRSAAADVGTPTTPPRTGSPTPTPAPTSAKSSARPTASNGSPGAGWGVNSAVAVRDLTWHVPPGTQAPSVAFSPDSTLLAVGGDNQALGYLYNVETDTQVTTFTKPGSDMADVGFSPDGKLLASSNEDGHTYFWDVASMKLLSGVGHSGYGLAFSPDSTLVATGNGFNAYVQDIATGDLVLNLHTASGIFSEAFSPNGKLLAAGGLTSIDAVFLWDVSNGDRVATLHDPNGEGVDDLAFSPDGRLIAAADDDGSTYLWEVGTGALVTTLTGVKPPLSVGVQSSYLVGSVAFSPDGTLLAAAEGKHVYLWNVATHALAGTFTSYGQTVTSVAFGDGGKLLAAVDTGGYIYVRETSQLLS
jgi:hypothetical protein